MVLFTILGAECEQVVPFSSLRSTRPHPSSSSSPLSVLYRWSSNKPVRHSSSPTSSPAGVEKTDEGAYGHDSAPGLDRHNAGKNTKLLILGLSLSTLFIFIRSVSTLCFTSSKPLLISSRRFLGRSTERSSFSVSAFESGHPRDTSADAILYFTIFSFRRLDRSHHL